MLRSGLLTPTPALQSGRVSVFFFGYQMLWDLRGASFNFPCGSGFFSQDAPQGPVGGLPAKPTCHLVAGMGTSLSWHPGATIQPQGFDLILVC